MQSLRSIAALGTLALLTALLSACGGPTPPTGGASPSSAASTTSSAVNASPASDEVTIVATDSGYDVPASIPSGVTTFRMINRGTTIHWVQLAKIPADHSVAELEAGTSDPNPIPSWLLLVGGPNTVDPGDSSTATLNLDPGQYAVVLFNPGAKNLVKPVQVTGNKTSAAAPAADITIKTIDYGYEFATPVKAGKHTIRVENVGPQAHEVVLVQLLPGKTVQEYIDWEKRGEKGAAPGKSYGGLTALSKDLHGYFTTDLTPGNYLVLCYVPDARDGKPHYLHGMYRGFSVS